MAFSTPDHIQPHPPTAENIGEWLGNMTPTQRKVLRAVLRSGYAGYAAIEDENRAAARELAARNVLSFTGGVFIALPYIVDLKTAIFTGEAKQKEAPRG